MDIRFATQSYKSDALAISAQRCVNAYCEIQPKDAKSKITVHGFPGADTFATAGDGPIRGFHLMGGILYVVSGTEFFSVTEAGVVTPLGTDITGLNPVSIAGNGLQIVIVNGTALGWTYTVSGSVFAQIADSDFQGGNTVAFMDGYFIFDWPGTNKFFISGLLDGTAYDALDFASAESSPDRVLSVLNNQGILLVFGEKTIEPWDHTGAVAFPFQRWEGGIPQRGLSAALAVTIEDNSAWFLGDDHSFYRLNGIQPIRVSTHAIEKEWETYDTVDDAFCFPIIWGGHKFIYITFPTEGKTFGYDIATELWHERISWDPTGDEAKWRANCSVHAYQKTMIGDANSGKIGFFDRAIHTEFGDPVRMILVAPPIHGDGLLGTMPLFEIDMKTGVGIASGQGSDPQVMLDWSDDGGETWVSPQLWRTMGAIGAHSTRIQWDQLGEFYQRTLRLEISDPVQRVLIAARCPGLEFEDAA